MIAQATCPRGASGGLAARNLGARPRDGRRSSAADRRAAPDPRRSSVKRRSETRRLP